MNAAVSFEIFGDWPASNYAGGLRAKASLHQQHLAGALDGAIEAALIMRGQPGVFSGENAALIGDKLLEQVGVLEIQGVHGEVDLRFGPGGARFTRGGPAARSALFFVSVGFAWHKII